MPLTAPTRRCLNSERSPNMPTAENQPLLPDSQLRPPTASRFRRSLMTLGMILILGVIGWYLAVKESNDATYLVHNANVYTVDERGLKANAFVVENGKFVDIGSEKEIMERWPNVKRKIDLHNRTVVPGLIDSHGHLMEYGHILAQPRLNDARSVEEVRAILKLYVENSSNITYLEKGPWLQGWGWDQTLFPSKSFPTAADLDVDPVLASIPIVLRRRDGHASWINGRVIALLRLNGVDLDHAVVDGGEIVRDPGLGVLLDNAMDLVDQYIPPFTEKQNQAALSSAISALHSVGITSIHDAGVSPDTIEFYKRSHEAGRFRLRNYIMIKCPSLNVYCGNEVPKFETIDGILKLNSVKLFMDGALGSWGAAMLEPYQDDPSKSGILRSDPSIFPELVKQWIDNGYQVNTHCIGDRGNRIILDSYERNLVSIFGNDLEKLRQNDYRLRIEHAQILTPSDIQRTGRLAILPSMQPTHATSDMGYAESRLGYERTKYGAYAWRSFLDSGVPALPLGSDFPVESPDPRKGIYSAVTRRYANGSSPHGPDGWFPEQRLSRMEALRGFTLDAAYGAFMEESIGSISKNKFADFVVFDQDILTVPEHDILNAMVLATVIGGHIVFGNLEKLGLLA
ncbi:hypothetical protein BC938DRAFT_482081 [Jimgerdemannia flammicorona]|uniref:Amidohydrolase 3 domain-containing protein n=1 Tax=Jimgerdemannia flammicorona TaxID=994334 RepID=A0A433QEM4_9FUNG|nr:hypothetical protein BC938DRAFT_482081 [Jimgerdemannia flammicorona]